MKRLNLGCGQRFHSDWENVDFSSTSPQVRAHNLRKGIPYPDGTFDLVYHSHVLEHFSKQDAPKFLRECHRVLKQGGVIRVAVPDLEKIARLYLEALEKATLGIPGWAENYDWMVLEMYDQAVRERSGGAFREYFSQEHIPNWDFIHERAGGEANVFLESFSNSSAGNEGRTAGVGSKLKYAVCNPFEFVLQKLLKMLLSKEDYQTFQIGRFRRHGEIHQWMYDAYSLARSLRAAGFRDARRCGATESQIPGWAEYCLDNEPDGTIYKPASMYMEAVKP